MQITCPHCQFSKDVNQQWIPRNPSQVECPDCQGTFYFSHDSGESLTPPQQIAEKLTCPKCGQEQPQGDSCVGCGVVFAKLGQNQAQTPSAEEEGFTFEEEDGLFQEETFAPSAVQLPKAGFWIRFVAVILDGIFFSLIMAVLTVAATSVMGVSVMQMAMLGSPEMIDQAQLQTMGAQMSMLVLALNALAFLTAILYFVAPIARSGQTPGKKICGVRVIRKSGDRGELGFGRALLREIIGKWLSGLIFMIGYLMAAFHGQKQALHDLVAGTYVIKAR